MTYHLPPYREDPAAKARRLAALDRRISQRTQFALGNDNPAPTKPEQLRQAFGRLGAVLPAGIFDAWPKLNAGQLDILLAAVQTAAEWAKRTGTAITAAPVKADDEFESEEETARKVRALKVEEPGDSEPVSAEAAAVIRAMTRGQKTVPAEPPKVAAGWGAH